MFIHDQKSKRSVLSIKDTQSIILRLEKEEKESICQLNVALVSSSAHDEQSDKANVKTFFIYFYC